MKGILISAFGRRGYIYSAFNLLASIKYFNPDLKVALAFDREILTHISPNKIAMFDELIEIPKEKFFSNRIDPAIYKTSIYDFLPYDETLVIDADSCALKDLTPFIEYLSAKEGNIFTDVMGYGKPDVWASLDYMKEFFGVDVTFPVQSSWMYIKKDSREFFDKVKENFERGVDKSKITLWGGTVPDELIYQGTFAQMGINPAIDFQPVFFGNTYAKETVSKLYETYYILSLYGNGNGRREVKLRYIEFYDRIMRMYCEKFGLQHDYKSAYIMTDKHLNF